MSGSGSSSGLKRIILIATHLPGVVELKLDGHTNVCGTNASGKTTLQRLVPIFFGELPSKVVPRTRKKFSEFYLPHANSYLIYEYQREDGQMRQAVVTRKDADSVQYRFVASHFEPEQILVEMNGAAQPLMQEQWVKQLKQLGIEYSSKINSTSEFRSIIQNDASVGRANSRDNVRLRQLSAFYSLVDSKHRIRHMEKLVSAVHAKEGKMDTLRTMLAAIFEEDGLVQPTTTVRNNKARDWITQMRQTKRLETLHEDFSRIEEQAAQLHLVEQQLQQLQPALEDDFKRIRTERADTQEQRQHLTGELEQAKAQYEAAEFNLNGDISEGEQQLNSVTGRIDSIQSRYDQYLDSDMDQLEKDMRNLPLWREQLEAQQEQYNLLIEQHKDLQAELDKQKNKLFESLERLQVKNKNKSKEISGKRADLVKVHQGKETELRTQYEQRREQQAEQFDEIINELTEQLIEFQYAAKNAQLTEQEQENAELADKRVELAQRQWQQYSQQKASAEKAFALAKKERDQADDVLIERRRKVRIAKDELESLQKQLSPEQGSLRQFLRDNQEGWEHRLGKVIHAPLLERKDLSPSLADSDNGLLGIQLDLAAIDSPDYAQDEEALKAKKEQYITQLENAEEAQTEAEASLRERHQLAEQARERLSERQRQFDQADEEVRYANEAKQRLTHDHRALLKERQKQAQNQVTRLEQQKAKQKQDKQDALATLKFDFEEQLLEFRSDWQEELALLDEQIDELETQVEQRRQQNRGQIKQLEAAFEAELASKDIEPKTLKVLKQKIDELNKDIQRVSGRRDELTTYQEFLETAWKKQRPELLQQEITLKADLQELKQKRDNLKQNFQNQKAQFTQQIKAKEQHIHQCNGLITEIEPLVRSLSNLCFRDVLQAQDELQLGDQQERISRCNESLETRSRAERKLKEQLNAFENVLGKDAGKDFLDTMQREFERLQKHDEQGGSDSGDRLPILKQLLSILKSKSKQIVEQGETIGGDLANFFKVFSDINRKISSQSKRLTEEVADDLVLDGIARSEVKILSTVDELNFWKPLKTFAESWNDWRSSGDEMPKDSYLDSLADVVEVLPNDASYNIESLLRLELHLNEGGSDLVIRNDRQLLESSSHGMAYLILCKFLLAFTRLLRNKAEIDIHWPIDEIGTLAYHNVEKLFKACDSNKINILGAFPNPESEVLMLFKHRYLIDKHKKELQKIEPKISRISQRLKANKLNDNLAQEGGVNP